jgi:hypothetical protein
MNSGLFTRRHFNLKKVSGICTVGVLIIGGLAISFGQQNNSASESIVQRGLAIAPVPLNLHGKNRALVGTGSYLVNAVALCNNCHTSPSYLDNPFVGDPGTINTAGYMAGGASFGPVVKSRNLTPDALGRPAGLSLSDFKNIMRTGLDDDAAPPNIPSASHDLLQTMPWPVYRNMTDDDLRAIYEYLSAIPCIATAEGPGGEPPAHSCTP